MAKKKKKQRPKQGHPARLKENVISLERAKLERELNAITPQFIAWFEQRYDDNEIAPILLSAVSETLGVYADVVGLEKATDFNPTQLFAVMSSMIEFEAAEDPEADGDELRSLIYLAVSEYAEFLGENGLWQGDLDSLAWLVRTLQSDEPFTLDEAFENLDVPKAPDEAVAQITAMPIFKIGQRVLSWALSAGKDLYGGGRNEKFLPAAIAAVGDLLGPNVGEGTRQFTVASTLAALEAAEALELDGANAPNEAVNADLIAMPDGVLAFEGVYGFLRAILDLLLGEPVDDDRVSVESWGLTNLWLLEAVEGQPHRVDAPRDEQFSPEAWTAAHERMQFLRHLGLVESGDSYSILGVVRLALTDLESEDEDGQAAMDADMRDLFASSSELQEEEPKRLKRTEPYKGKVLQLKLALRDVKPPIWRRVLVPADLNLADLHDIIQTSFDWSDSHLHQFYGKNYKPSYGPQNSYMESDIDESTVLLSKLFKKPKDRLSYAYDFGDDWRIGIEVEDVLKADDGQLPRCIGGRRMGPLEDSGGPWRWSEMVEELKNEQPLTMMEDVLPEEFVPVPGEDFDPAVFSIEEINEFLDQEF